MFCIDFLLPLLKCGSRLAGMLVDGHIAGE